MRSRFTVAPDLSSDLAGGEQRVAQRQHQSAIRGSRLQDLELALQLGGLLLRGIGREQRGVRIAARIAGSDFLLGTLGARNQGVGFRAIGFTGTRVEARLFALLIQCGALLLRRTASRPVLGPFPPCDRRCRRDAPRGRDPSRVISATLTAASASLRATGARFARVGSPCSAVSLARTCSEPAGFSGAEAQPANKRCGDGGSDQ